MGTLARAMGVPLVALALSVVAQERGSGPLVERIAREGIERHVDFDEATRLAAGPTWAQANAGQKKRLVAEFRQLLVRLYANAIALYPVRTLKLAPSRGQPENVVRAHLAGPGGQAVPVEFLVRPDGGGWTVYDISVDGVSLVRAYRADFDAAVKQGGIEGLIKRLADKNAAARPI